MACPFPKGNDNEVPKIIEEINKFPLPEPLDLTKLGTKVPKTKGIQVFQMKGHTLFKGEIIVQ